MDTIIRINRQAAARWLADHLHGKTPEQWELWLRNNANLARPAVYRVPVEQIGRNAYYRPDELKKFAQFEQSRQLGTITLTGRAAEALQAFGVGDQGGAHGRSWKGASANLGQAPDGVFVQTVIKEPLLVFAMTPDQAIAFGNELLEAGMKAQEINRGGQ